MDELSSATSSAVMGAAEAAHSTGIHVELAAIKLGQFWGIPITNSLLMSWAVMLILTVIAIVVGTRLKFIPSRIQTLLEWIVEGVYDYVAEVLENREMARKFLPLLVTIFLFILTANLIEFTPGIGSIGFFREGMLEPLFKSMNTDLNVPLAFALIAFFVIEFTGIATLGVATYGRKFLVNPIKDFFGFAVGLLELIGDLVRIVSLSFRLFGNILAGEVIIIVATYFAPWGGPLPFMMFELFIGTLQAAIFALLTLFFIKLAITEPHSTSSGQAHGAEAH